jgi:hypothetical protein
MPTKRQPRYREWRLGRFSPEVLTLFVRLERMSQSSRKFKDGSRELAHMLGLVDEWWTCQHVNDRSSEPCHPPGYIAYDDWFTCREYRTALLAAASPGPRVTGLLGG